jgi:hypothetical protein
MIEFNPDGSIKLPGQFAKQADENKEKLKSQRCIRIKRNIVSSKSPKKCLLQATLSDVFSDNKFMETIFRDFNENSTTPCKLVKIDENNFEIEIGTEFRRCTECCSLVNRYREFLDGNVIEDKGSCTFEQNRNFCYEDYF